jgi:hypothetical protein
MIGITSVSLAFCLLSLALDAPAYTRQSREDRLDGGKDRRALCRHDVATGPLEAPVGVGEGLVWREKRGTNVRYGLKDDALTGALVHLPAEVCPWSIVLKLVTNSNFVNT